MSTNYTNSINSNFRSVKSEIEQIKSAGYSMPSETFKNYTLGASGTTYTAPANGWFYLNKTANSSSVSNFTYIRMKVNSIGIDITQPGSYEFGLTIYVPVRKNDIITVMYNATGATNAFRFYYAQGSESEAV